MSVHAQGPVIDVWNGLEQTYGDKGNPQKWINVLGNTTDPDGIRSVAYRLNGGGSLSLNIGPDTRRLFRPGDFNIEFDHTALVSGTNSLLITATDKLGNQSTSLVTLNYVANRAAKFGTLSWAGAAKPDDVLQVVDGEWTVSSSGIRPSRLAYDRTLAFGDKTWTNYEITVPITYHGVDPDPSAYLPPSVVPGFGFTSRWPGHSLQIAGEQPLTYWLPQGGGPWYDVTINNEKLYLRDFAQMDVSDPLFRKLSTGKTYNLKLRVETLSTGKHFYGVKMWEMGFSEPSSWEMTHEKPAETQASGGALFVLHHIDATIGNVTVTPVGDTTAPTIQNVAVAAGTNRATISWTTSEPSTGVVDSGVNTSYGSSVASPELKTDHEVVVSGLNSGTSYVFRVVGTDLAGNSATHIGSSFKPTWPHDVSLPVASLAGDDFNATRLGTNSWALVDPAGGGSVTGDGSELWITSPSGSNYQAAGSGNTLVRVMRRASGDFTVGARFNSIPTSDSQAQGVIVEQDVANSVRLELVRVGTATMATIASLGGTGESVHAATDLTAALSGQGSVHLGVHRAGDRFTFSYSLLGVVWVPLTSIRSDLEVTALGLFSGSDSTHQHIARIDDFAAATGDFTASVVSSSTLASDEFTGTSLGAEWAASDPYGRSSTTLNGGALEIAIQKGFDHTAWLDGNGLAQVTRQAPTGDFSIEARFNNALNVGSMSSQGFVLRYSNDSFLRIELQGVNSRTRLLVASVSGGTPTVLVDRDVSPQIPYGFAEQQLWVGRNGDDWTIALSANGTTYYLGSSFKSAIVPATIGISGGGSGDVDRMTSVDWFRVGTAPTIQPIGSSGSGGLPSFPQSAFADDDFNGSSVDVSTWLFVDPLGDATAVVSGGAAQLTAPSGRVHNAWTNGNTLPRLIRAGPTGDFSFEANFDSSVTTAGSYKMQGFLIEQDGSNYLRIEFLGTTAGTEVFIASVNGASASIIHRQDISSALPQSGAPLHLWVGRQGDTWTVGYSADDGANWRLAVSFTSAMVSNAVSVYAGSDSTTSQTAVVDHFKVGTTKSFAQGGGGGATLPPIPSSTLASDVFPTATLDDSVWVFHNPLGDGTISTVVGSVSLTAPDGKIHDPWTTANTTPRIMRSAPDNDFAVEVHFAAPFTTGTWRSQGIVVQETNGRFLRVDLYCNGAETYIFAARIDGSTATVYHNQKITAFISPTAPNSRIWLRRVNDDWTVSYATTDTNWQPLLNFNCVLDVTAMGVFAGSSLTVSHTVVVEKFLVGTTVTPSSGGGGGGSGNPTIPNSTLADDSFAGTSLDATKWAFFDPAGDASVSVSNGAVSITAPSGEVHDPWTHGNTAPRIMRAAADTDLSVEVRFTSPLTTGTWRLQGLLVQETNTHYIRCDIHCTGSDVYVFIATVNGSSSSVVLYEDITSFISPTHNDIRLWIGRVGNVWTVGYAKDATSWQQASSFTYAMTVTAVGAFAGSSAEVSHTAVLDEFLVGTSPQFNTGGGGGGSTVTIPNSTLANDTFDASTLDTTVWAFFNPHGDASIAATTGSVSMTAPSGNVHDPWTTNTAARIMRHAPNTDFAAEVGFSSSFPEGSFGLQGLLIQESETKFIRADFHRKNSDVYLFVASIDGATVTTRIYSAITSDVAVSNSTMRVWVGRKNDDWTVRYSKDDSSWKQAVQFTFVMNASAVGVSAGSSATVTHTAIVDEFLVGTNPLPPSGGGSGGSVPSSTLATDEFNGTSLDPNVWLFKNPTTLGSVFMTGTQLKLVAGVGNLHDCWTHGNTVPRVIRAAPNSDFTLEAKLDSALNYSPTSWESQGLQVQETDTNYLRIELLRNGTRTYLFIARLVGSTSQVLRYVDITAFLPTANTPMLLRVTRTGSSWTVQYAPNELNWSVGDTFTQALTVSAVALYAGGSAGNTHTTLVDYFKVTL